MNKKMLFVYNPKAGKGMIKNHLSEIIDIFTRGGYEVTVIPTQRAGQASKIAKKIDDCYDCIACSGGDGTLDEVVSGLLKGEKDIPVGYIPAGSTNDFGYSLGISNNMRKAAVTIVKGKDFLCDVGRFNNDYFVYVAAFGVLADVAYQTNQDMKNKLGYMAYIIEGLKKLASIKSYKMKISYDDKVIEDEFILGMVTNSISVGGFKNVTGNNVKLNDGMFEVLLIKKFDNPLEMNEIITSVVSRKLDSKKICSFTASSINFEASEEVGWTLDGEFGGMKSHVYVENLNRAFRIKTMDSLS